MSRCRCFEVDSNPRGFSSGEVQTTTFYDIPPNIPQEAGEHLTFMWRSHSIWMMTQAARWGQIKEIPKNAEELAKKAWRTDLYREIAAEMGIECPKDDFKVELPDVFIRHLQ
jgi:nitrate/nitrite transport system substrate-binding protein